MNIRTEDNFEDISIDFIKMEMQSYCEYENKITNLEINIFNQLNKVFAVKECYINSNSTESHDDELKKVTEKNKDLQCEIESKLEKLSLQQTQYEKYKKDMKLLTQEIKQTHEAFLMAKKYYKTYLKMYYTIESRSGEKQKIFIQFFTEAKKDTENFSVRLLRHTSSGQYQLLSTTPKLSSCKELQKSLQHINDVPEILCTIRQAFIDIKTSKK